MLAVGDDDPCSELEPDYIINILTEGVVPEAKAKSSRKKEEIKTNKVPVHTQLFYVMATLRSITAK